MSLDVRPETYRRWLMQAVDEVVRVAEHLGDAPAATFPDEAPLARFGGDLPQEGEEVESILSGLCDALLEATAVPPSPRFFGYIVTTGHNSARSRSSSKAA